MRKKSAVVGRRLGLLVGVEVRLGLLQRDIVLARIQWMATRTKREGEVPTSCFFSSTLSETASLAAVRRVVALASVWPLAISVNRCQR